MNIDKIAHTFLGKMIRDSEERFEKLFATYEDERDKRMQEYIWKKNTEGNKQLAKLAEKYLI